MDTRLRIRTLFAALFAGMALAPTAVCAAPIAAPASADPITAIIPAAGDVTVTAAPDISLRVFAAASLKNVLDDISGTPGNPALSLVYGASTTLARQIARGAPADLFLSADAFDMDRLAAAGVVAAGTVLPIARNTLVIVGRTDSPIDIASLPAVLAKGGPHARLAMGDPGFVPAGRYARAALISTGLWQDIAPLVVYTQDVRAALTFVARGDVPLAAVYASDLKVVSGLYARAALDAGTHRPAIYMGAVVTGANGATYAAEAQAFLAWLRDAAGQAVFAKWGFVRVD